MHARFQNHHISGENMLFFYPEAWYPTPTTRDVRDYNNWPKATTITNVRVQTTFEAHLLLDRLSRIWRRPVSDLWQQLGGKMCFEIRRHIISRCATQIFSFAGVRVIRHVQIIELN
jgi:hypothetical protein